ncbi:hypothetical protein ABVS_2763 [Acinetobacter lwoffii]|jgi:hypothetical protein|nr:hypothetical protein ABVS_2763 [Acinetobacter lwoffii]
MGYLEFIEMTREEFRANLYQTYVSSSVCDPVLIQEYIRIAESFVFDGKQHTAIQQAELIEKLKV